MNNLSKTLSKSLGVALVLATGLLAGCELYFGDHSSSDSYSYCGSDGQYTCDSNNTCTWVGPTCDAGGSGFECTSQTDCAAGCYCDATGTCEEGGFCGSDGDCGSGYTCDTSRSSCEPTTTPTCGSDTDCPDGQVCDPTTTTCTATCTCESDGAAVQQGFGWCDETRNTCMTGTDPAGDCNDAVTCNDKAPVCAEHQVPLVANGCYTGACRDITACEGEPVCTSRQFADDCSADTDCSVVSVGHNCTKPDGTLCTAGDANCTCESFTFESCDDKGTAAALQQAADARGALHSVSVLQ